MLPLLIVSAFHLWFEKPAELALYGPSDAITLLIPALNYMLTVWEYVRINPYAFFDDPLGNLFSHFIFLRLRPLDDTPETLTATMCMLAQGTSTHGQT